MPDGGAAHRRAGAGAQRPAPARRSDLDRFARPPGRRIALDRRPRRRTARARHNLARGALRTGQDDARVVPGAGAAARAHRTGASFDAGRMRDRRTAGQPAYRGNPDVRRAHPDAPRLRRGPCRQSPRRAGMARLAVGRRDGEYPDGRGARARPHHDRERGARARGAGPRADALRDGRAHRRRRQPRDRNRRRRASRWRRAYRDSRPYRGRLADDRGGDDRRRRSSARRAAGASGSRHRQAQGDRRRRSSRSRTDCGSRAARRFARSNCVRSRTPDFPPTCRRR